jgi:hypothetical protein
MVWAVVRRLNLHKSCLIDMVRLAAFALAVEEGYRDNPYHCRIHAADVVHGIFYFLKPGGLRNKCRLNPHEVYAMVVAAAIHDFDHPGQPRPLYRSPVRRSHTFVPL